MKLIVCKGCGQQMQAVDKNGNPSCVTCIGLNPDNSIPIEVEMPDEFTCDSCNKTTKTEELLKRCREIPFATKDGRYYCGCRGWE